MPDVNTGAVSTPAVQPAVQRVAVPSFIGGFPPGALTREAPRPADGLPVQEEKATSEPQLPEREEKPTGVTAEMIRKQREDRLAREQAAQQAKDWETKYNELKAQSEGSVAFEDDPVGYARTKGWDKEKQLLYGQMLLYDLAPDKAPGDLRIRLFESKQERKEREAADKAKRDAEQAESQAKTQRDQETYQYFVGAVDQAAAAFEPGSYPESEAWFINPETGDMDHDTYVRSMLAMAVRMADQAQAEGRVADLSPASIAKTLEAEVTRRMAKRDEKRKPKAAEPVLSSAPVVQSVQAMGNAPRITGPGGMQPTESTKGSYGSGGPAPKAVTDAERISRAAAVAFRTPGSR